MIQALSEKRRFIAVCLFAIIYFDLALSLKLHAAENGFNWHLPSTANSVIGEDQQEFSEASGFPTTVLNDRKEFTRGGKTKSGKPDIGGPGQPEMSSFQSVNSSNMVDLFTGDFSYNLPLLDVGGYPVNIHYASGVSMDQEASWVGLGWNVNPGTISRNMRGLPDDFNGDDYITREQSVKENKTVGVTFAANVEYKGSPLKLGANFGIFSNTYNGWGLENGINASINAGQPSKGTMTGSLGLAVSNNSQTGLDVSPNMSVKLGKENAKMNGSATIGSNYNSRSGISGLQLQTEVRASYKAFHTAHSITVGMDSYMSFATPSYLPTVTMPMTSKQFAFTGKAGTEFLFSFLNGSITGYSSKQYIDQADRKQNIPAYGYLNFSKASTGKVLMDFNREKEVAFNEKSTPHLPIPQYTYDLYSITGEGTGGMFRPYRGDVGYIFDHQVMTKSVNDHISGDFGAGLLLHGGIDFSNTTATTETGAWISDNDLLKNIAFAKSDTTFQEVYFRNPGEKAINNSSFYTDLAGDSLIRFDLSGAAKYVRGASSFTKFSQKHPSGPSVLITKPIVKRERDKRTQVITYLNAQDASLFGLEKNLRSYKQGLNPVVNCTSAFDTISRRDGVVRKGHHLSEIDVLNADGRRYVYGLPVYNVMQRDVTFAVDKETTQANLDRGLVAYDTVNDNNLDRNSKGKDGYFNADVTPGYAHSFLLTGLLSPDYVDITGDGITEDDLGDGVKFNYSEIYGAFNNYYNWRTPGDVGKANYNEGLKSYQRDDKATYMFGKKEVWYLHSVESKTMIAVFNVSDRTDAKSILTENGGYDNSKKLKKLDSIQLFVKADLVKNATTARAVKTVHFEYSYELCKNILGNPAEGKLTLKKLWFTYNGNNKGKLNPYNFTYSGLNPTYNSKTYDRWGNYKDPVSNPGSGANKLSNLDYPYAIQNKALAGQYASAWSLTEVRLPSGGKMEVTYESDDYGYVQNKRATQMFQIAGFGNSPGATPIINLYAGPGNEYDYVFVNVTTPVTDRADITRKYLDGLEKLYFKVAVKMPSDNWGKGFEMVPTYAEIDDYGTVTGNTGQFWIRLKRVNDRGPLAAAALQFLRLNLPSKAYPGSELSENLTIGGAVKILLSNIREITNVVAGFENVKRLLGVCKSSLPEVSFVRLNSPDYQKFGGGHRVKSIKIWDNWSNMTTRSGSLGMRESVYGQEYQYSTSLMINGVMKTISSGVAAYEPMIGTEENPFRTPMEYLEKVAPLSPTNYSYTETPLGESFFPSPMVGYSKVRVRTVNAKTKSANGWEESEFYTTKDFPTITDFTPFDGTSRRVYNPKLKNFLRINAQRYLTVSQGFKVELNDMNGKMKSQASYPENDSLHAMHYTRNIYKVENDLSFQPRLSSTVSAVDSTNGHINTNAQIGREVEVMVDVRQQLSKTFSGSISPNIDLVPCIGFPIPLPSVLNIPQHEENRFRSVVVTKIVQRYGLLDSVAVLDKGSLVSTKNLVYDGETGEVILSRTNNEFNDYVYNFSYPAHWAYSGMGLAYKNVDAVYSNMRIIDGRIMYADKSVFPVEKHFESGDEVMVVGQLRTGISAPANGTDCNEDLFDQNVTPHPPMKLWVIAGAKGKDQERGLIFIDEKGIPYSAKNVSIRILRSGHRNMTDAMVGGIVSMATPVKEVTPGRFMIVIDSNTRVINTTAAVFKDLWHVQNTLYQADSCYTVTRTSNNQVFTPTTSVLFRTVYTKLQHRTWDSPMGNLEKSYFMASSLVRNIGHGNKHARYDIKSVMTFDLRSIPPASTVTSATLTMPAVAPRHAWDGVTNEDVQEFPTKDRAHYNRDDVHGRDNSAQIKAVSAPWNLQTLYQNIRTAPEFITVPAAGDATCTPRSLSATALAQRFVSFPVTNFGMVIDLTQAIPNKYDGSAERTQTYCAPIVKDVTSLYTYKNVPPPPAETTTDPNACITCASSTTLTVSYTYQKDTCVKVCRNNINDTALNPYRWGILGNWRMDRSYVYYFDRKESDVLASGANSTNIRFDGELKQFIPYWKFTDSALNPSQDSSKWVWNSATTHYNRKGFEIENADPLGRYNSGLYGYNQSVPVAVAQNSKYREILFDGFEDYGYSAQGCVTSCPTPRSFDFLKGNTNGSIDGTQSHTGRYSFKVNANAQTILTVPLVRNVPDTAQIYVGIDSTPVYETVITGKGKGLSVTYRCATTGASAVTRFEGPINHVYDTVAILPNCGLVGFLPGYQAQWDGIIQPKYTDYYRLFINSAEAASITIDGTNIILPLSTRPGLKESVPIRLIAGKLYTIRINYPYFRKENARIQLGWYSSQFQSREIIPLANLYGPSLKISDTTGSLRRDIRTYCIKGDTVEPIRVISPSFSLSRGSKVVVGGWVRVGTTDCISTDGTQLPDAELKVTFNTSATQFFLQKTGQPIEGWQRYEAIVDIPAGDTYTQLYLTLKSPTSQVSFYDDMRILPFNANMKSFVYDPVNLRLMAELDENNYSTFYEYDDDGTLIRVKKETEKGIKTLKETRSALSKEE